jgi:hypothetical protein
VLKNQATSADTPWLPAPFSDGSALSILFAQRPARVSFHEESPAGLCFPTLSGPVNADGFRIVLEDTKSGTLYERSIFSEKERNLSAELNRSSLLFLPP